MRVQNWPHALAEYLRACNGRSFVFGKHDCAHFAAGAVEAITGVYPEFPRYQSASAARRLLSEKPLRDRAGSILAKEIPVSTAKRGDIVLVNTDNGHALGVCVGEQSQFLGKNGEAQMTQTIDCVCAWSVE
jgi:hypothetical protein